MGLNCARPRLLSLRVADIVEFAFLRSALVMIIDAANFVLKHAVFFRKHGNNDASPLVVRNSAANRIVAHALAELEVAHRFAHPLAVWLRYLGFAATNSRHIWLMTRKQRHTAKPPIALALALATLALASNLSTACSDYERFRGRNSDQVNQACDPARQAPEECSRTLD